MASKTRPLGQGPESRAAARNEHGLVASRSLGIAWAVPPLLVVPLLSDGGVAPILVAAAAALLVGAPAAIAEWRTRPDPRPLPHETAASPLWAGLDSGLPSVAELVGLLLVATALAELASAGGTLVLLLAILVWPAGAALVRLRWTAVPAVVGLVGIAALAATTMVSSPPWTLLEPHWDAWPRYLGPAASAGVLLGGAGTGHWTIGPRRPPGDRHTPWAVVGLGLLVVAALAVEVGARFEHTLGVAGVGVSALVLTSIALLSATASLSLRSGLPPLYRMGTGLGLTLVLAGPAGGIRPWVATVVVPALAALLLAGTAGRATGGDRLAAGAAAAVLATAAAVAWPGVPDRTFDAVWIGLLVVGAFWFVATRTLLARRTA